MSHFLDRLTFFQKDLETFSDGHGIVTNEDRSWEDGYRKRWSHDKIVRSTHGVNCTGSCSWKIYVKGGIVTWETQQTDYPRTRPDLPNHEPRGCARGASYSWYLYSGARVKYPMVRGRLLKLWREARRTLPPVAAWASIVEDQDKRHSYTSIRGHGGLVRSTWDEVNEIIASANAYTAKQHGPDRIIGFSPIPAMSMVSYAAGSRYLSLLGGTCMSFYDWYCDLPPASPQTWGEQTDVPESADWYNAGFIIVWGSNVPQTRTPDAHFYSEVRYKGTKSAVVSPDYAEATKFADIWLNPKQGTDAALALAMGHVILREYHLDRQVAYFDDYLRRYSDMPFLVRLAEKDGRYVPERMLRASEIAGGLGEANNPDWKTVAIDEASGELVAPRGSVGYRWGEEAKWNLEEKDGGGSDIRLKLTLAGEDAEIAEVDFPYFGGRATEHFVATQHGEVLTRNLPVRTVETADGETVRVATVYDLMMANYGLDRGFGGGNVATSYDEDVPFTPAWAERITGVKRDAIVTVAREFATNAEKTNGRSMVILGAGLNHWYHMDMSYRGIINLLVFCGAIGQSGGGWSHYVGQEKLRPQTGWLPLAFGLDWSRPPRQMNSTSFFYAHTDQWRYETLTAAEIVSPTAPDGDWNDSFIDYNVRAERMGWLPSAPQLKQNPLTIARKANEAGLEPKDYVAKALKSGELELSCHDPDDPANWPRNMFVWRSNILGSSGKGHEYFLRHLLGTKHGVLREDLGDAGAGQAKEVVWHDQGAGRKARPPGHARLPHVDHLRLFRHRSSDGHLVREERPQHLRHASLHPSALRGGGSGLGGALGLGHLQGPRQDLLGGLVGSARQGDRRRPDADPARHRRRDRPALRRQGLGARRGRADPRQDDAVSCRGRARLSEPFRPVHRTWPAVGEDRQRREGHRLEDRARGRGARPAQRRPSRRSDEGHAEDRDRHRRCGSDPVAGAGDQRRGRGEGLGGAVEDDRPRACPSRDPEGGREDPLPGHPGAAEEDHLLADLVRASSPRTSATAPAIPTSTN